jgi:hypothetical protein
MNNQNIRLLLMVLITFLIATGCTHKPYHPNKSDREWAIDHEACERWAREGIRDDPDTYDYNDEMKMIRQCMKQKGWQWERTDLFKFENRSNQ